MRGCTKVSPGCKNCYAETFAERWRGVPGHPYEQGFDLRLVPEKLAEPLAWKKPRRVFVNSMSDLFHESVPDEYIAAVFGIMSACAERGLGHTFQVLTKRSSRMKKWFERLSRDRSVRPLLHEAVKSYMGYHHPNRPAVNLFAGWPLHNVWLGVSVENQKAADERIPDLLKTPAAVRFISAEPLLGPVRLDDGVGSWLSCNGPNDDGVDCCEAYVVNGPPHFHGIDWVICGGESGPGARPMHPDWARSLRDQCVAAGVAFHFKQWGAFVYKPATGATWLDGSHVAEYLRPVKYTRVGKKFAGRMLDGRTWDEFPGVRS